VSAMVNALLVVGLIAVVALLAGGVVHWLESDR